MLLDVDVVPQCDTAHVVVVWWTWWLVVVARLAPFIVPDSLVLWWWPFVIPGEAGVVMVPVHVLYV